VNWPKIGEEMIELWAYSSATIGVTVNNCYDLKGVLMTTLIRS
jgi:hypothetical protein